MSARNKNVDTPELQALFDSVVAAREAGIAFVLPEQKEVVRSVESEDFVVDLVPA